MQYYITTAELARKLGLDKYSKGNDTKGYLVHQGDLVMCDIESEMSNGQLKEVTISQAKTLLKTYKTWNILASDIFSHTTMATTSHQEWVYR